ncbi:HD domain-containing protein [Stygiolobus caldivivus]|uniref:Phosphohydrolase n=1 Tax=Stygiolobus caldivivus TaxID=2824673 RepID=A0A8D5U7F1_9CREN|nr:HD domain-containing protein [Stygiolobus caldivivus]BCU70206.1 phosphohydrolase [Stygiolobus caldivivus]
MSKLIRDPIHGYVEVSDRALGVISDPYFQRLRYITQNALAYLVYPGMRHTRFEHSLGVMYLIKEFLQYIKKNSNVGFIDDEYIELVGVTGLLHDIGHLAFSHTFESGLHVAKEVYGENRVDYKGKKTHVYTGIKVIEDYLSSPLEKNFSSIGDPVKFVVNVLKEEPKNEEERLALQLVSNFVDADRGDYLLRDSYYAGVGYGSYDIERLKRVLTYVNGKIAVLKKAIPIVEQFLLARMYMFKNVYFHSVVGMYNSILSHAIAKLILEEKIDLSDILHLTDVNVLSMISSMGDKKFSDAIFFRSGYKRIKSDIEGECLDKVEREKVLELSRETNGGIIYYEFFDTPYREEKEAVYIYDGENTYQLSKFSNLLNAVRDLKKAIIVYHVSQAERVREFEKEINECLKASQGVNE